MKMSSMINSKVETTSNEKVLSITDRELEVLVGISQGMKVKEIAESLFLSCHTVISHKKSLLSKFKAKNCVDLAVKAIKHKIISIE